jgi:tRNA dimethylallyltransferase
MLSLLLQAWLAVPNPYPAIAIIGPTASGKTRLGIALALRFSGEIVSCDALQVYRHMDIGTAKASAVEQALVRHHLLDLQEPDTDFSAGDYQRKAREALGEIRDRSHIPFVVGGTGFYLRALIEGLFEGPARSETIRIRIRKIMARKGSPFMHRVLARIDPVSAEKIEPADAERVIRAYEVYLISGKSMSWWQQQPRNTLHGFVWLKIGIGLPRALLYQRIDQRVEDMFRSGLVEEVQALLQKYPKGSHAFKAIGYRQITEFLEGKCTLPQAIEETKKQSRNYAKRQLTWFRASLDIAWLDGEQDPDDLLAKSEELARKFLERCESGPDTPPRI